MSNVSFWGRSWPISVRLSLERSTFPRHQVISSNGHKLSLVKRCEKSQTFGTALSQSDGWTSLRSTLTLCIFTVAGAHVDQTVVTTLQEAAKRCGDLKPWHNLVATFKTASFRAIPNSSKFYRTNSTSLALLSRRIRSVIRWCLSLQEVRTRLSGLLPLALDHAQDQTWHLVLTPSKRLKQWFQTGPQMTRPLHPAACE